MLSRALSLATVTLLIGCFGAGPARAQAQNLEAGKSPSQIFAGTCTACHKSPRGLLKTVPPGSLPTFLRQHYTTSSDMAGLLSAFLVSNGASDTRYVGTQPKPGKDAKPEARPGGPPDQLDRFGRRLRPVVPQEASKPEAEPREAAKPDADEMAPQTEPGRHGRNGRRFARPGEPPDAARPAADGQPPAQAASEHGPDGRKLPGKQRLSKRGKPGGEEPPKEEPPKSDAANGDAAKEEAAKGEAAAKDDDKAKAESAKAEGGKPEEANPSGENKSESAKSESAREPNGEAAALRADPAPPVTSAPPASPAVSAGASGATSDSAPPPAATQSAPPAVTASAPPVAPAGPPAPPISQ
jgi:hypothetical protein